MGAELERLLRGRPQDSRVRRRPEAATHGLACFPAQMQGLRKSGELCWRPDPEIEALQLLFEQLTDLVVTEHAVCAERIRTMHFQRAALEGHAHVVAAFHVLELD